MTVYRYDVFVTLGSRFFRGGRYFLELLEAVFIVCSCTIVVIFHILVTFLRRSTYLHSNLLKKIISPRNTVIN